MSPRRLTGKPRRVQSRPSRWDTKADVILHAASEGAEQLKLLDALLSEYGLDRSDPDRWFWLSLRLAQQYVPDFRRERGPRGQATSQARKPPGEAEKRPSGMLVDALAAAHIEIAKRRLGTERKAREFLRQKGGLFARYPDSTLRDMARRGRKGILVNVARMTHGEAGPERIVEALDLKVNLDE